MFRNKADRQALRSLGPAIVLMTIGAIVPTVVLVALGFSRATSAHPAFAWSGVDNFRWLFASGTARDVLFNTVWFTAVSAGAAIVIGSSLALLLVETSPRLQTGLLAVAVMPWAISSGVAGLVWMWMFYDIGGAINRVGLTAGLFNETIPWLGVKSHARLAVVVANTWRLAPFVLLTMTAALRRVGQSAVQAATLDGAGPLRRAVEIRLPAVKRLLAVVSALVALWCVAEFALIYVLTRGGPGDATHVINTKAYEIAFRGALSFGYGAACALLTVPLTVAIAVLVGRSLRWRY